MKTKSTQNNIPDGWDKIAVGKVFSFLKSYAISRENLINGTPNNEGIGNIHYGDIHSTYGKPSINLKDVSVPLVKDVEFIPKSEDLLRNGDLIMADVSEDYAGIGVTVSVHGLDGKRVVGGLHTFVLRDTRNKTIERYRQYIFRNPNIRNQLQKIANGVSVYGISKTSLSNLLLILPPLSEQKRIVAVLETWDSYLEKLERKIELKKNIKKGLMQQLLSGNKRLPGAKGEWEMFDLGELGVFKGGNGFPEKYQGDDSGDYPFFKVSDMNNPGNKTRMVNSNHWISRHVREELKVTVFPVDTIVLAKIGAALFLERKRILIQESCIDNNMMGFIVHKANPIFMFYKFLTIHFSEFANTTALPSLSGSELSEIKVKVPKSKEEQSAIAKTLTMVDEEIELLEDKKKIIEDQKKFLLNNLITGKIRTPESMKVKL